MNSFGCIINKSEEKTRKHWLLSTFCFLVFYPLTLFAFFAILSHWLPIPKNTGIGLIAHAFTGLFSLWIVWHCAYKKYGTRLLTFWLIIIPFKQLASIVEVLKETWDLWTIFFLALDIGVFLWWYLLSLKMRKVNKSIQERLSFASRLPG